MKPITKQFTQRVVNLITNVDEAAMRRRYPKLDWGKPKEALEQAKFQEFKRLTDGLDGADKGSLAERWYAQVFRNNPPRQVDIFQAEMQRQGLNFTRDRAADLIVGDQLIEIKNIKGKIAPVQRPNSAKPHDLEQYEDFIQITGKPGGVRVTLPDGTTRQVQRVRYIFTDPRGVKANADWMVGQIQRRRNLSFEVFNWKGERVILDKNNINQWRGNLDNWLGQQN